MFRCKAEHDSKYLISDDKVIFMVIYKCHSSVAPKEDTEEQYIASGGTIHAEHEVNMVDGGVWKFCSTQVNFPSN